MTKYIVFYWTVLRPDIRQYKQQSIEMDANRTPVFIPVPDEMVFSEVEVPLVEANKANGYDDQNKTMMIYALTVPGMQYVQSQLEAIYPDANVSLNLEIDRGQWESDHAVKEDDWGPDPSTQAMIEVEDSQRESLWGDGPDAVKDDDWGSEPVPASGEDEWGGDEGVFSDEPGNVPDTDTWNESEEDWQ